MVKKYSVEKSLEKPVWLKYTKEEVKNIILKLANKGLTAEKIGLVLRDQYGIPSVKLYNLKIKQVLEEAGLYVEPTLKNLEEKVKRIEEHFKKNKQDKKAKYALIVNAAKLRKKKKYYERKKEDVKKNS